MPSVSGADVTLEKSNIPGWTNDLMSYRALVRFDGQGTWNEAITPRNGDSLVVVRGYRRTRINIQSRAVLSGAALP